jgi:hypothetical protein
MHSRRDRVTSQPSDERGHDPRSDILVAGRARVLACLAALLVIVTLSWCSGTGRWTAAEWDAPTKYLDGFYADVVSTLAGLKASADGRYVPFAWKNIPELGAPYDGNWNDMPSIEEIPAFVFGCLARTLGLFVGLNAALLSGHLLAAATMFLVCRRLDCSSIWSFVAALAYGLAPFIFAESPHHIMVAHAWHVPLFLLVWRWVAVGPGLRFGTAEFRWAVAIAIVTGMQNAYWTNVFCQLTLLGALVRAIQDRSSSLLRPALTVVMAAALTFALMNIDAWTFHACNGPNPGALVREYKWLEIYGLKLVDLVVPPVTHRARAFADFAAAHRAAAPLQDEGSYLGLAGLAALVLLVTTAASDLIRRRADSVPVETWWVLWIVVCFSTGGLNAILGACGFTLFRTGCRYSIVILAIVLAYAARRLTAREATIAAEDGPRSPLVSLVMAALACLVILLDQVPRPPAPAETAAIAAQVASDREFVGLMEAALPPGAMVFQLPIMEFPESPVPGIPAYDHLRPYLYSRKLRFSFGSMKGRTREQWQRDLGTIPLERAVEQITDRGFAAIYLNRNGFPDKGKQIIEKLREMGFTRPQIVSSGGDLVCIPLVKG